MQPPFSDPQVAAIFANWPQRERSQLLALRALVFAAATASGAGALVETLKWGEPAWHPLAPRTGTTVRLNRLRGKPGACALYVPCQTNLIDTFRDLYGDRLQFEGRRAILFGPDDPLPVEEVQHCIALALTCHLRDRRK